jgi:F plasmid transfer operon, TraF, protein
MDAKITNWKLCVSWPLVLCLVFVAPASLAAPFGMFDARSMAMGGVGVATGPRFAVFNNPALLTAADEIHEWFLLVPTVSEQLSDPANVENSLAAFQQAANVLDTTPGLANQAAVQQQLDALDGSLYGASNNTAVMLAIPSRILSGAAFFNVYEASTAQPQIGGDNLATPSYASALAQRGFRIAENGVAAAMMLEANKSWMRNLAVGFSAKFLMVEAYGYSQPLRTANVEIDRVGASSGSQFAFDVGILKEFGVWKLGLVAKNIVPGNYNYGSSGGSFRIEPQLRAGFAYQSRYSVLELDVDLLENAPVGFNAPSQIAALGWEWQVWRWLALRAGYNQNLSGEQAAYTSAGVGLSISTLQIDVAAYSGDLGEGVSAQLGLQF